jgi:DisA bacterial checkpoint controller nucleotide-binding
MTNKRLFTDADPEIESVSDQFEHLREISGPFVADSPTLTKDQIADFVDTAYWSSLLANEGRNTHVRLAAVTQQTREDILQFSVPVRYEESQIARLSPAVPHMGCLLVDLSKMEIWGISRKQLPFDTITLKVVRPGVVQVGVGLYRTFLVFAGRTATQVLSTGNTDLPQAIRTALRKGIPTDDRLETQAVWREALALADVARNVVKNGHGGTLLVVPDDDDKWRSCIDPLGFGFAIRDSSIPDSIRSELKRMNEHSRALQEILQTDLPDSDKFVIAFNVSHNDWVDRNAIDAIARMAAIDGAVVLTSEARVIGFGSKISVKESPPSVSRIGPGSERQKINSCELEALGGMRHQSAARFVGANHNCAAIVVSEDGPMSFMSWHAEGECVLVVKNADWWC